MVNLNSNKTVFVLLGLRKGAIWAVNKADVTTIQFRWLHFCSSRVMELCEKCCNAVNSFFLSFMGNRNMMSGFMKK